FVNFASSTAKITGKPWTFIACVAVVLIWAASGPVFGFNETWQLVINTGTTIVTFLMVFLIQNTQNRDGAAMQAKMDELIHAVKSADEGFVGIEHLTDKELAVILARVESRARRLHGSDGAPVIQTRAEDTAAKAKARKTQKPRGAQKSGKARTAQGGAGTGQKGKSRTPPA